MILVKFLQKAMSFGKAVDRFPAFLVVCLLTIAKIVVNYLLRLTTTLGELL
jgi:hypothetical protein